MSFKEILEFEKINIEKLEFHFSKEMIAINVVDVESVLVTTKHFLVKTCFQYLFGYKTRGYKNHLPS